MKSSFCIDLQRFMLIPTKFPLSRCKPKIYEKKRIRIRWLFITLSLGNDNVFVSR